MNRERTLAIAAALALHLVAVASAEVTFDWVNINNPGNKPDSRTGAGAVSNRFRISRTEVTNLQYVEFLNSADPTGANALGLYNAKMSDRVSNSFGGIENTGEIDGARYFAIPGREYKPVNYVSWYDSVRFVNWLHNGQQGRGTEAGAYTLQGGSVEPSNGLTISRNPGARYWLPSMDEWYKAAYHDASAGLAGDYFRYATGSDVEPISDQPSDNPNAANYQNDDRIDNGFNDGYAVSGSFRLPLDMSPLTDVGAYTEATSPYGTLDQNGNVYEWIETVYSVTNRNLAGGGYSSAGFQLDVSINTRSSQSPTFESEGLGLRVASASDLIPEPTSAALALIAVAGVGRRRRGSRLSTPHRRNF